MERARVLAAETGPGVLLRQWRARRRLIQLDLAMEAGVTSRHLSFVETGRAQPSRDTAATGRGGLETRALLHELLSYPDGPRQWQTLDLDASTASFLPIEFHRDDLALRYVTTEALFPADDETEAATRRLSG
jgi:transcriptional regulator with XRE-family HTH domain